jgi:hypothetical protein
MWVRRYPDRRTGLSVRLVITNAHDWRPMIRSVRVLDVPKDLRGDDTARSRVTGHGR